MGRRFLTNLVFAFVLLVAIFDLSLMPSANAFPTTEKTTTTGTPPLSAFSGQPAFVFVPTSGTFKDRFLYYPNASSLGIFDLETWAEYTTTVDTFSDSIVAIDMLNNGTSLILGLANGNLARIELDDESTFADTDDADSNTVAAEGDATSVSSDGSSTATTSTQLSDSREINSSLNMSIAGMDKVVADGNSESIVYMISYSNGLLFRYSLTTNTLNEVSLVNSLAGTSQTDSNGDGIVDTTTASNHTATDMVYASSDGGNKLLITTNAGFVLVADPTSLAFEEVQLTSTSADISNLTPNLAKIALTSDQNFALITDTDNDVIWMFSLVSDRFLDQQDSGSALDPLVFDSNDNATFTSALVFEDSLGGIAGYVSGTNGISLLDLSDPENKSDKIIDADAAAGGSFDPIAISATPGPLARTSNTAGSGYIFSANGDASLSILTDNPWINITAASSESLTADTSTFNLTFNSDASGNYTVYANSNPSRTTGTELISSQAVTGDGFDVTTADIDINAFERSAFIEGKNKIFVFVDDGLGNLGHTAKIISIDRPPEAVTITGVNFGNKLAYISFELSPDADIDHYNLFAQPATNQSNPDCPGSLSFESSLTASGTVTAEGCGTGSTCDAGITGLINDIAYCVAVSVVDLSGQVSPISTFGTAVTPERTVGPAGFLGESGCALNQRASFRWTEIASFLMTMLTLFLVRSVHRQRLLMVFIATFFFLGTSLSFSTPAFGEDRTPQSWTLEVKGTMWLPTDSNFKNFTGSCCHFAGEVEFGWLLKNRFNLTVTAGAGYESGSAVGVSSGSPSGDKFGLLLIPMRMDFIYRFDYKPEQFLLPYLRTGFDAVFFRESSGGETVSNVKFGAHAGAGLGFLLDKLEEMGPELEDQAGINDIYLIIEGRYAIINSFKSTGLDLSGFYPYLGVLFEF